jgi:hypothetical protein
VGEALAVTVERAQSIAFAVRQAGQHTHRNQYRAATAAPVAGVLWWRAWLRRLQLRRDFNLSNQGRRAAYMARWLVGARPDHPITGRLEKRTSQSRNKSREAFLAVSQNEPGAMAPTLLFMLPDKACVPDAIFGTRHNQLKAIGTRSMEK